MRTSLRRFAAAANSSSPEGVKVTVTAAGPRQRRRSRHRFGNLEEIPSLHEFQQKASVRNLYRSYWRTTQPLATSQREDLRSQIRQEFRGANGDSSWDVKRSISEGTRRLKELSTMLGTSVSVPSSPHDGANDGESQPVRTVIETKQWPWQASDPSNKTKKRTPPPGLPNKSLS